MKNRDNTPGFSLFEVLIALAIICVITAWALPSYQNYISQARRKNAEQILFTLANALEEYAIAHNSYANASLSELKVKEITNDKMYRLKIASANSATYAMTATPINKQAVTDKHCGTLSLNSLGVKKASGKNDWRECW